MAQPVLPAEGTYGEIEKNFIENSPPGLWPDNQDSNFGQLRKTLLEPLQECSDKLTTLDLELYAKTAEIYLSLWEQELGLPVAPTGKTTQQRRDIIAGKMVYGPFTRPRRAALIESFIITTYGAAASLTPEGIALDAGGVPLFSGAFDLIGAYRVYEDIRNFSYEVWIKNTITPDIAALTRELTRITPGGFSFTIDNTKANVLDYFRLIRNGQPVWYSRLNNNANDVSGYALNGTVTGATLLAAPGLLDTAVDDNDGALDFDGVNDWISVADAAQLDVGDLFSVEFWIRLDGTPGAGLGYSVARKGAHFNIQIDPSRRVLFTNDTTHNIQLSQPLATATTYHVVVRKSPLAHSIMVNGVESLQTDFGLDGVCVNSANILRIGTYDEAVNFMNGVLDELAIYNRYLSDAEVLENYNTGINTP